MTHPAVLISELTTEDGPHTADADLFAAGRVCGVCDAPKAGLVDDDPYGWICEACIAATERVMPPRAHRMLSIQG